jgi:hypothetical protein
MSRTSFISTTVPSGGGNGELMSRWYAFLGGLLLACTLVALLFQAWALGIVLLLVGGGGLLTEMRQRRRSTAVVAMSAANGNDAVKAQVLALQQQRDGQGWAGGGFGGSYG